MNQKWQFESESSQKPVTVLGRTFATDAERRAYFTDELRRILPELKTIPGFPVARDEDILALSDPPYYTACPNPFLPAIVAEWQQNRAEGPYHREPFAADVSEGKNDPIYNAHAYHTKVPPKAIMRYLLHYTEPGDIVLDGFAGTGMTGVAAQLCGDRLTVESLGYRVLDDGTILKLDNGQWVPFSRLGVRRAILNDLSPAATFIAYNYNTPTDPAAFQAEAERILATVERECGWMYRTLHHPTAEQLDRALSRLTEGDTTWADDPNLPWGQINYTVWSDVFLCPACGEEMVFWDVAVDQTQGEVRDTFHCPGCGAAHTKRTVDRAWVTFYDDAIGQTVRQAKQVPVLINYSVGKKREDKTPDAFDRALLEKIQQTPIPNWFPTDPLPEGYNTRQPRESHGLTHVHHFYSLRTINVLSSVYQHSTRMLQFVLTSILVKTASKLHNIGLKHGKLNLAGALPNTLYVPSQIAERNIFVLIKTKLEDMLVLCANLRPKNHVIKTQSSTQINLDNNIIDYIFLDPPFGSNIMYSELNFLWEAWLKVFTNNEPEAIVNAVQHKGLPEYQQLMLQSFREAYRLLKPGRWMTVEFSNTQASIWNAIHQAIQQAGFVIANVAALDKQQGSFKAVTTTTAVKKDLVISAYKPVDAVVTALASTDGGDEAALWAFVDAHLTQLPVFLAQGEEAQLIDERTPRSVFDRVVRYYVAHGWSVPMDSAEFQAALMNRYPVRDGMVFLPEQLPAYDRHRMLVKTVVQTEFFIMDEATAIDWLRQQLAAKPQTYADLQPAFMKEIQHLRRHEVVPGLDQLLEENFLQYDGKEDPVPEQIVKYLKANYHQFRNGVTPELKEKAKGRWYVPDPRRQMDVDKLRQKRLLREFDDLVATIRSSRRRLKQCRSEVVRAGLKKLWSERDYATIVAIAEKLPDAVVNEDTGVALYVDNARGMLE
ncbi:MAG: DNA methyltransferase [Sulfobacillus sp.]|nr:DNA methyltransferase [Sulfobacillus sp.]